MYISRPQLLLIDGDELVERPAAVMDKLLEVLGLPFHPFQNILQSVYMPIQHTVLKNPLLTHMCATRTHKTRI